MYNFIIPGSPSLQLNRVQYQTHSSKKDCYKYSFVLRSIIQWNNIDAPDDHKQFKSLPSSLDLRIWVATPIRTSVTSRTLQKCSLSLKRDTVIHTIQIHVIVPKYSHVDASLLSRYFFLRL